MSITGHTPLPSGLSFVTSLDSTRKAHGAAHPHSQQDRGTPRARCAPAGTPHPALQPLAGTDSMLNTNSRRRASESLPEEHMHMPFYRLKIGSRQFFPCSAAEDLLLLKHTLQFLLLFLKEARDSVPAKHFTEYLEHPWITPHIIKGMFLEFKAFFFLTVATV